MELLYQNSNFLCYKPSIIALMTFIKIFADKEFYIKRVSKYFEFDLENIKEITKLFEQDLKKN